MVMNSKYMYFMWSKLRERESRKVPRSNCSITSTHSLCILFTKDPLKFACSFQRTLVDRLLTESFPTFGEMVLVNIC